VKIIFNWMGSRNKELLLLILLAFSVGGVNTISDSDCKFGALRFKRGGGRRQRGSSVAVRFKWRKREKEI